MARSIGSGFMPRARLVTIAVALFAPVPAMSQSSQSDSFATPWSRMPVTRGNPVDTRPFPPRAGRKRCIGVNAVAGAQMFGASAIELTMRDGNRYRLFFARECPALSFYQGFYYKRRNAGQLCAGRDVVASRSGGECAIASILPVRRFDSETGASKSGRDGRSKSRKRKVR